MQTSKCSYFDMIFTLTKHSAKHWNWREDEENFRIADPNQNIYYYVVVWLEPCSCRCLRSTILWAVHDAHAIWSCQGDWFYGYVMLF